MSCRARESGWRGGDVDDWDGKSAQPGNRTRCENRRKYENVFAAVGVHPHDAKLFDDAAEAHLIALAESEKVIAWGEIGLDFYYDHSPREVQFDVFRSKSELREIWICRLSFTRAMQTTKR
jgi:hypothetical protein